MTMMLDKSQELAYQSRDAHSMRKVLEKTRSDWNKLSQEAANLRPLSSMSVNRHRRLQTSMELCRKYDDAQGTNLLKLGQAEEKWNVMRPIVLKKNELDEQIKEF